MQNKAKMVAMRFARGFVAGACGSMVVMTGQGIMTWSDLSSWISALTIAGITGGVTGGLMALDKYLRS